MREAGVARAAARAHTNERVLPQVEGRHTQSARPLGLSQLSTLQRETAFPWQRAIPSSRDRVSFYVYLDGSVTRHKATEPVGACRPIETNLPPALPRTGMTRARCMRLSQMKANMPGVRIPLFWFSVLALFCFLTNASVFLCISDFDALCTHFHTFCVKIQDEYILAMDWLPFLVLI